MRDSSSSGRYNFLKNLFIFLFFLYLFFVSIELMGAAFKTFGRGFAEKLIATTTNPFIGLFIGLLSTSIVQSSSLTTSILVGMVAAGTLSVRNAIPVVMGANIGTTVTNLMVSMAHIKRKQEFQRALAGAVVHDFFNVLSVAVILPLHILSQHILGKSFLLFLSEGLADIFVNVGGLKISSPLKVITGPLVKFFQHYLFDDVFGPVVGQKVSAILMLLFAMVMLFIALILMTRAMKAALIVKMENLFDAYLFKTAIRAFLVGLVLTAIIQSSSVTTSLAVPLIGAGILTIEQIFPYTLGANIGTTVTAILASMATGNKVAVTVAFAHLFFNIVGTAIWYPLRIVPITMAKKLAGVSAKSRKLALFYLFAAFYLIPGLLVLLTR